MISDYLEWLKVASPEQQHLLSHTNTADDYGGIRTLTGLLSANNSACPFALRLSECLRRRCYALTPHNHHACWSSSFRSVTVVSCLRYTALIVLFKFRLQAATLSFTMDNPVLIYYVIQPTRMGARIELAAFGLEWRISRQPYFPCVLVFVFPKCQLESACACQGTLLSSAC
jgi:hypothetical protein